MKQRSAAKIVALLSFRDEEPFLPFLLASLAPLVDHVVALDDRSTDAGPDLLRASGATVTASPAGSSYGSRRQLLLETGRSAGGTHFVVVDADEAFTAEFSFHGRRLVETLPPGGAFAFPFRTLWKGTAHYRIGREYSMPLACVFHDDQTFSYQDAAIHESRLPGVIAQAARVLPDGDGSMVHLQFSAWERAQVKQAWYRCKEFLDGSSAVRVNARYLTTLDRPNVKLRAMDRSQLAHLPNIDALRDLPPSWHLDELMRWFRRHGPSHFESLQIWHVAALRLAFEVSEGRPPRTSAIAPPVARVIGDLYGSGRAAARRLIRLLGR